MESSYGSPPRRLPVRAVRRDESGDADKAGIGEQRRHFSHPPDVLSSVVVGEAKVRIQAVAYIVTVEHVDLVATREEFGFQRERQRRLA